jgi:hypothetical protein
VRIPADEAEPPCDARIADGRCAAMTRAFSCPGGTCLPEVGPLHCTVQDLIAAERTTAPGAVETTRPITWTWQRPERPSLPDAEAVATCAQDACGCFTADRDHPDAARLTFEISDDPLGAALPPQATDLVLRDPSGEAVPGVTWSIAAAPTPPALDWVAVSENPTRLTATFQDPLWPDTTYTLDLQDTPEVRLERPWVSPQMSWTTGPPAFDALLLEPLPDAVDVPVDTQLTLAFTLPPSAALTEQLTLTTQDVPVATEATLVDLTTLVLTPTTPLLPDRLYTLHLQSDATSDDGTCGRALPEAMTWTFRTAP